MAISWWFGCISFFTFMFICHLQKLLNDLSAW
jgi:hypothetical protein